MNIHYISFTDKGQALARRLAAAIGGEAERCRPPVTVGLWTAERFRTGAGLVYVGAAGIAVRAIVPFIRDKTVDPAVVVVDELGRYAVPILSGHMGGANALAGAIAAVTGGEAVITTATDVNGLFSVDCWAKRQGCAIPNKDEIKFAAAKILSGDTLKIKSRWPISGDPPVGVTIVDGYDYDVCVDVYDDHRTALHIVPPVAVLGIGCRKGIGYDEITAKYEQLLAETGLIHQSFCAVASIDLKKDESGIIEFCESLKLPFLTYSSECLKTADGDFTPSEFVERITGVDNVCERAAAVCSGGAVIEWKRSYGGVTFAVALKRFEPDWSV